MENGETEEKYERFLSWFKSNGGVYRHIEYPAYFPPTNYIGLKAAESIPRNTVIMSVPKRLIISIDLVKKSEIGFLLNQYPCFYGQENDDKDFNILTLYLILQKMKGQQSFFDAYLECITIAETMIHWSNQEIMALEDPFLNLSFLEQVRKEFQPTYNIFQEIINKNRHLFHNELTKELFYQCYGITMTRCFGWGLPETMLVPFADFLNHHSEGVHHYTFSLSLQNSQHPDYIKKMKTLDLRVMGIDNTKQLPIGYEKDQRQIFLENNEELLNVLGLPIAGNAQKLTHADFNVRLNAVRAMKVAESYDSQIYPSSQSQDNDTNSQDSDEKEQWGLEALRYIRLRKFLDQLYSIVDKQKEEQFSAPKPQINREFQDGVKFDWWYGQDDASFIVATSRDTDKGEQIFNSYGRRSNRFLLLWYGFAFEGNKYDSLPFRVWAQKIEQCTGQLLFTRYITDVDWKEQIPIGNQRYPYTYLSNEFRLKKTEINYKLLAFLRFRIIRNDKKFAALRSRYNQLYKILNLNVEKGVLAMYKKILMELIRKYKLNQERDFSCLKKERMVFATLLTESNAEIVQMHCKGVEIMERVIDQVSKHPEKQSLSELYRSQWPEQQSESGSLRLRFRLFLRSYFKLLQGYLNYHQSK